MCHCIFLSHTYFSSQFSSELKAALVGQTRTKDEFTLMIEDLLAAEHARSMSASLITSKEGVAFQKATATVKRLEARVGELEL